jgi:hypothetical protein
MVHEASGDETASATPAGRSTTNLVNIRELPFGDSSSLTMASDTAVSTPEADSTLSDAFRLRPDWGDRRPVNFVDGQGALV